MKRARTRSTAGPRIPSTTRTDPATQTTRTITTSDARAQSKRSSASFLCAETVGADSSFEASLDLRAMHNMRTVPRWNMCSPFIENFIENLRRGLALIDAKGATCQWSRGGVGRLFDGRLLAGFRFSFAHLAEFQKFLNSKRKLKSMKRPKCLRQGPKYGFKKT